MNPIEDIIYNSQLYSERFINTFGVESPHWFNSNWHSRERSLRHDMVCVLLCNNEDFSIAKTDEERTTSSGTETSTSRTGPSNEEDMDWEVPVDILDFEPDESEAEPINYEVNEQSETQMKFLLNEWSKRFILLEGTSNIAQKQNLTADSWGCMRPNSQWDIIDRELKRFIEVKVTINKDRCIGEFEHKSSEIVENSSLFVVNPETADIYWIRHPGGLIGEQKVKNFLIRRSQILTNKIYKNELIEDVDLENRIFCNKRFNKMMEDWVKPFWESRFDKPIVDEHIFDREPDIISPQDLLSKLKDPRLTKTDKEVKWRGKILPEVMVYNYKTEAAQDAQILDQLIHLIGNNLIYNKEEDSDLNEKALLEVLNRWANKGESQSNFKFIPQKEMESKRIMPALSKQLGILAKRRLRNDTDETTIQPEYKTNPDLNYGPWFDSLLLDMSMPHNRKHSAFTQLENEEIKPINPMAIIAKRTCTKIIKTFNKTLISYTASKLSNIYSRLGGSYLIGAGSKSSHCHVSIMPIYATARGKNNVVKRYAHGVLVRAPHHARSSTDKINIFTIEMVSKLPRPQAYLEKLSKATIIRGKSLFDVVIKQNAIMKIDPSYLTFCANALFVTANMIGELMINDTNNQTDTNRAKNKSF